MNLLAISRLTTGVDIGADATDLDIVDSAAVGEGAGHIVGAALAKVGADRDLVNGHAVLQGEEVAEGQFVAQARRPARFVDHSRLDLGEVCASGVDGGHDIVFIIVAGFGWREVCQRCAAKFLRQAGERAGETGVIIGGDFVLDIVAATVGVAIGLIRPADQRAIENVALIGR